MIEKLKNKHKIFIITSRDFTTYSNEYQITMQEITKKWLYENEVLYDGIIFSSNKDIVCKENKIDVMIEDNPKNIISICKNIPVICYTQSYNKKINKSNVYKCYSWYDIYNKINELKNNVN